MAGKARNLTGFSIGRSTASNSGVVVLAFVGMVTVFGGIAVMLDMCGQFIMR